MKKNNCDFPLTSLTIVPFLDEYKNLTEIKKEEVRNQIIQLSKNEKFIFLKLNQKLPIDIFCRIKEYELDKIWQGSLPIFCQLNILNENIETLDEVFPINIKKCNFRNPKEYEIYISPLILFYLIRKNRLSLDDDSINQINFLEISSSALKYALTYDSFAKETIEEIPELLTIYKKSGKNPSDLFNELINENIINARGHFVIDLFIKIKNDYPEFKNLIKNVTKFLMGSSSHEFYFLQMLKNDLINQIDFDVKFDNECNILHLRWDKEILKEVLFQVAEQNKFYLLDQKNTDDLNPIELLELNSLFFKRFDQDFLEKILNQKKSYEEKELINNSINNNSSIIEKKKRL